MLRYTATRIEEEFFQLAELARAPLTVEAVRRIDAIFDVERSINGLPVAQRLAIRKQMRRRWSVHSSPGCGPRWGRRGRGCRQSWRIYEVKYADTFARSMPMLCYEMNGARFVSRQ